MFNRSIAEKADSNEQKVKQTPEVSRFVLISSNRISRLDLESHRTFSLLSKIYLFFFILTPLISVALVFGCLQWVRGDHDESRCSSFVQLFYYLANLLCCLNSSIVNPVGFVALSRDLMSCLKARSHRKSPVAKELKSHEMHELSHHI